jgi:hypothetical protein
MTPQDFEAFLADAHARGFDEVLVREWAPGLVIATHDHPFEVDARVVRGEVWLAVGGQTRHLQAGDAFTLARGLPHAEHYGPEGATFWVARRNAVAGPAPDAALAVPQ